MMAWFKAIVEKATAAAVIVISSLNLVREKNIQLHVFIFLGFMGFVKFVYLAWMVAKP